MYDRWVFLRENMGTKSIQVCQGRVHVHHQITVRVLHGILIKFLQHSPAIWIQMSSKAADLGCISHRFLTAPEHEYSKQLYVKISLVEIDSALNTSH